MYVGSNATLANGEVRYNILYLYMCIHKQYKGIGVEEGKNVISLK